MTCRLVPAGRRAAAVLSVLHRTCFPEDPWDRQAIVQIAGMPGFFGAIATSGGEAFGFALALGLGKECELLSLGVVPDWRRRGIGGELLDWVCAEGRRRGAAAILLEVAEDNPAARALYRRRGFQPVGRRANYYRRAAGSTTALVLRLALPADISER